MSSFFTDSTRVQTASAMFEQRFTEMYPDGSTPGYWQLFTEKVPATSRVINVDVVGAMPTLEEWIGAKTFKPIRNYSQTARLKKWHKTIKVERMDLRYDNNGMVGQTIDRFLNGLSTWYDKMATDVLIAGTSTTGYDGVALFSASHPHGPSAGTQSNLTTSALSFSTVNAAIQTMGAYADENNEPLPVTSTMSWTLMVGPKLWQTAVEIAEADKKAVAVTNANAYLDVGDAGTPVAATTRYNVWRGRFDVVLNPRLIGTYDDYWFLINTGVPGVRPFLLYEGRAPEPIPVNDMASTNRFINDEFWYSVESDGVVVAGAWQTIYAGIL